MLNFQRPVFAYMKAFRITPLEIHFIYSEKREIYYFFWTFCIISDLNCTKCKLFHDFNIFCSSNAFFVKRVLKFNFAAS